MRLTRENINNFTFNFDQDFAEIATTVRTKEFMKWRFLEHPYIQYCLYGYAQNGVLLGYVAIREEELLPFNYKVSKIVDLFGSVAPVKYLLKKTISEAFNKHHIYVDFAKYGALYDRELEDLKFTALKDDDFCILPQVSYPIEYRPNAEFIGIMSKSLISDVIKLSKENVYFTKMDSDRDRVNKIQQLTKL